MEDFPPFAGIRQFFCDVGPHVVALVVGPGEEDYHFAFELFDFFEVDGVLLEGFFRDVALFVGNVLAACGYLRSVRVGGEAEQFFDEGVVLGGNDGVQAGGTAMMVVQRVGAEVAELEGKYGTR